MSRAWVDPGGWAALVEGGMRGVLRVLGCCAVLAGCYGAPEPEAEVIPLPTDLSQTVPPMAFFITCGSTDDLEKYPVAISRAFLADGRYAIYSSYKVTDVVDGELDQIARAYKNFDNRPNSNFFVQGLNNGCTGVFAASEINVRRMSEAIVPNVMIGPDTLWTLTPAVNDAIATIIQDPVRKARLLESGVLLEVVVNTAPRRYDTPYILIFDGEVYAKRVYDLKQI